MQSTIDWPHCLPCFVFHYTFSVILYARYILLWNHKDMLLTKLIPTNSVCIVAILSQVNPQGTAPQWSNKSSSSSSDDKQLYWLLQCWDGIFTTESLSGVLSESDVDARKRIRLQGVILIWQHIQNRDQPLVWISSLLSILFQQNAILVCNV